MDVERVDFINVQTRDAERTRLGEPACLRVRVQALAVRACYPPMACTYASRAPVSTARGADFVHLRVLLVAL